MVSDFIGEGVNEMRERELILKGGCTRGGTTMPEAERRPKLTQKPGRETSRRLTVGMNSLNLDRRWSITKL